MIFRVPSLRVTPYFSKKGAKGDRYHQTIRKGSNHLLFQRDEKKYEIRDGVS